MHLTVHCLGRYENFKARGWLLTTWSLVHDNVSSPLTSLLYPLTAAEIELELG